MPRMTQKHKREWDFFLDDRNRIAHSAVCRKCALTCKQSHKAHVEGCAKYLSKWRAKQNADGKERGRSFE